MHTILIDESTHDNHAYNDHIDFISYDQNDHNNEDVQGGESSHNETNTQNDATNLTQQDLHYVEYERQNLTRSTRTKSQPQRFKDYIVKLPHSINQQEPDSNQETWMRHPISNFVSYENFSTNHKAYMTTIILNDEPRSSNQASQDERWQHAMQQEI